MHAFQKLAAMKNDWHVNIGATPHEPRRHHSNHGAHGVVEPHRAPQHARVSAKLLHPELVAQYSDCWSAGSRVRFGRRATDERRHAHHVKRVHGADVAAQALRFSSAGPYDVADRRGNRALENRVAFGDLQKLVNRIA